MIEINLLSEEYKPKGKAVKVGVGLDQKKLIYVIPAAFAILILLHLCLLVVGIIRGAQLAGLQKQWKSLEPERKQLEEFNKEYDAYTRDAALIKKLSEQKIIWSGKLNRLSLNLPSGIWFTDIAVNAKEMNLRGSVVSLQKTELALINKFIDALKSDDTFFKDFNSLQLGPLQSRTVYGYDVTDFNLKGVLKGK
jgi:Tfp pilus assembly protein PilN